MTLRLPSTIGARGQTVIPKAIREQLNLQPGQKLWLRLENDRIVIEREDPMAAYEEFVGAFEKRPLPKDMDWDAEYASQLEDRWRKARK